MATLASSGDAPQTSLSVQVEPTLPCGSPRRERPRQRKCGPRWPTWTFQRAQHPQARGGIVKHLQVLVRANIVPRRAGPRSPRRPARRGRGTRSPCAAVRGRSRRSPARVIAACSTPTWFTNNYLGQGPLVPLPAQTWAKESATGPIVTNWSTDPASSRCHLPSCWAHRKSALTSVIPS
jgi:hypothetical protein